MFSEATPPPALLDAGALDDLVTHLDLARDAVVRAFAAADRPFSGTTPTAAATAVRGVDLDAPLGDPAATLAEVSALYLDHAVWFHHPHYQAHLNCPVALPAVMADVVASAVNSSMDTWDQSGAATAMERHLVDWTARRLGLPSGADGVFTSGGTQSNLQALLLARDEARARGARLEDLVVVTSPHAHFSARTAAGLLGLVPDAVVETEVDEHDRMHTGDLDRLLADLTAAGRTVAAVVATAGTTDLGVVDPLPSVGRTCRRHGVWLHVDAAYGGGLLTSRRRRHLLTGTERADSVTVDFHKTFFQPVAASALLVADRRTLRHATHHAAYLNPEAESVSQLPNQVDKSLQTTRRFDALKLWCTLRVLGADRLGELLDATVDLAAEARTALVADPDFEVVDGTPLSTVVFRWEAPGVDPLVLDRVNTAARDELVASGLAAVARTTYRGRTWLKLTLLNPATTLADVRHVVDLVRDHAATALHAETARGTADLGVVA
ncbi:pyridoxal phosphate-dependent decarboxylase family protein [Nocardioides perillae]|uniref:L-2,4-diaminobutyrate decarboxylase n=1 Tax=Nocardioides perillae TaxID=1119534 RepID=A0A7Y9RUI0_9ACTN|nr:aminotransferase class V-fold PLP-dependent enzyme [Nocardioides perillae]NYG55576.1 L-2,4-diaminobutyrate decarboxylase [Nocardioides perillae]